MILKHLFYKSVLNYNIININKCNPCKPFKIFHNFKFAKVYWDKKFLKTIALDNGFQTITTTTKSNNNKNHCTIVPFSIVET